MMKQQKSNVKKKVRSIDERESYFSYILSPYDMQHKHEDTKLDSRKVEKAIKHGDCEICEGDVNCEAEVFIRQMRGKLENGKTMHLIIE